MSNSMSRLGVANQSGNRSYQATSTIALHLRRISLNSDGARGSVSSYNIATHHRSSGYSIYVVKQPGLSYRAYSSLDKDVLSFLQYKADRRKLTGLGQNNMDHVSPGQQTGSQPDDSLPQNPPVGPGERDDYARDRQSSVPDDLQANQPDMDSLQT